MVQITYLSYREGERKKEREREREREWRGEKWERKIPKHC